ncbi:MAG: hypothetical protein R3E88_06635 [Myxococcota bacterium]
MSPRFLASALAVLACLAAPARADEAEEEPDPAPVALGERLFLETRFAQFFAANAGGNVNAPLAAGDPVVDTTRTPDGDLPGPFAGESINCRACHLVDEQLDAPGGGMRTYTDFAVRSPVPAREDGLAATPRNSPPLVGASRPRPGGLDLHFDGEFATMEGLVFGTLTGRNYGWLPREAADAVAHVARVVREDDGTGALAQEFGGAYRRVLAGTDPSLPPELVLPPELRVDVDSASDGEIVAAVARLIAAYALQLSFATDDDDVFVGSPFDAFVAANGLPARPDPGEGPDDFARRFRLAVERLESPVFVDAGPFEFHDRDFVFGPRELRGLQVFVTTRSLPGRDGVGNCAACHAPPEFTDFSFHNTGVSQSAYDAVHGAGRFARLRVPSLRRREREPARWLPATPLHPDAAEPFRRVPEAGRPLRADLGLWNVFANPDFPAPQERLGARLCDEALAHAPASVQRSARVRARWIARECTAPRLLPTALARFKTPGLRDLGHSAPYFHDGQSATLEDVVRFYDAAGELARRGKLRNGAPELRAIRLDDDDVDALVRFLMSLDEDYS